MSKSIPGAIYLNGNRYWWRVKLPGETSFMARPLKPKGSKFATTNRPTAEAIAKELYTQAVMQSRNALAGRCDGTIRGVYTLYMVYVGGYYRRADGQPTREIENIERALEPFVERFGGELADEFGPGNLKEFRQSLIEVGNLCRNTINQRIGIVRRMFRWAVSEELVASHVIHALDAVQGLKYGRCDATEREAIKPIDLAHVTATLPYATPVVRAMIQVQLYTGMRTGELIAMKTGEIDTSGDVWLYRPIWHKTKHFGHDRVITIGPLAKEILLERLQNAFAGFVFLRGDGQPFDRRNYSDAVRRAIRAANRAGKGIPFWSPNQLRHTAATLIRKQFGLDAAAAVLGHAKMSTTEIYAELDQALAAKAVKAIG